MNEVKFKDKQLQEFFGYWDWVDFKKKGLKIFK